MSNRAKWYFGIALLALLVWGLEQVTVAPLQTGEIYPPYSSLRSDPLGAKALYESLAALPRTVYRIVYAPGRIPASGNTGCNPGVEFARASMERADLPDEKKRFTFAVYLAGDNNLSEEMVWSLQEMRSHEQPG